MLSRRCFDGKSSSSLFLLCFKQDNNKVVVCNLTKQSVITIVEKDIKMETANLLSSEISVFNEGNYLISRCLFSTVVWGRVKKSSRLLKIADKMIFRLVPAALFQLVRLPSKLPAKMPTFRPSKPLSTALQTTL